MLQLKIILEKQRSYGTFRCILRRQGEKEVNHSVLRKCWCAPGRNIKFIRIALNTGKGDSGY